MFHGIDLYSDTATRPTPEMRRAMMEAELGDEQMGEDPTTAALERFAAGMLGQSAAIFLPSATMANQLALRLFSEPGDECLAADSAHIFNAEAGGPAYFSSLMARPIPTRDGTFSAETLRAAFRSMRGPHYPISRVLSVENTANAGGGVAWPLDTLGEVMSVAKELGMKTHLDGSRMMNAAVALGVEPRQLTSGFDTVTLCLSKGLGCPMGAILAYDESHYPRVRRFKQQMGGSMRQSGLLAAAGLYALQHHVERLAEDHRNARALAEGLSTIDKVRVENGTPSTNMVFFRWTGTGVKEEPFLKSCLRQGVRFSHAGGNRFRAVTHLDIKPGDIEKAIGIVKDVSRQLT